MRTIMLAIGAIASSVPAGVALPAAAITATIATTHEAEAQNRRHYRYREWRGRDGRMYCRRSNGTTGLVVGAAAGALLGRAVDTRGERTTGTILGAVAGGLAGREIDRGSKRRCR